MKFRSALLCVMCACATGSSETRPTEPATKKSGTVEMDAQKISNMTLLDLAVCTPRVMTLPAVATKEALTAALVALNPSFTECLVDPKNRKDPKAESSAKISLTADASGLSSTVTGDASASGEACLKSVAAKLPKTTSTTAVSAEITVAPGVRAVKPGVNDASIIAGIIRIAQPGWCECYAPLGTVAPKAVTFEVQVFPRAPTEVKGSDFSPLSKCIIEKVVKLPLEVQKETHVPFEASFINTLADEESPELTSERQFLQLDGIRAQRAADTTLAVANRVQAVTTYDGLVAQYKKSNKSVAMKDLRGKCAELVASDEALIGTLSKQLDTDSRVASLVGALKAKDSRWGPASAGADKQATATKTELDTAKKARESDAAVCPKER